MLTRYKDANIGANHARAPLSTQQRGVGGSHRRREYFCRFGSRGRSMARRGRAAVDVLMIGTGEYTTGFVDGGASKSDKGAGVVALTLFDLRKRVGLVGRTLLAGVRGAKMPGEPPGCGGWVWLALMREGTSWHRVMGPRDIDGAHRWCGAAQRYAPTCEPRLRTSTLHRSWTSRATRSRGTEKQTRRRTSKVGDCGQPRSQRSHRLMCCGLWLWL
jgi:hypothetical protein